jgi:hypothetical protein
MHRLTSYSGRVDLRYRWLGYPEGRDAAVAALGGELKQDSLDFTFQATYTARGEMAGSTVDWNWESNTTASNAVAPTGVIEHEVSLGASAGWQPWVNSGKAALSGISFNGFLGSALLINAGHQKGKIASGFECDVSVNFNFVLSR